MEFTHDSSPHDLPPIWELPRSDFPPQLLEIPQPPKRLFIRGANLNDILRDKKVLTIVGPRNHTSYAKDCIEMLVMSLRGLPVVIVSGLAYGIDSIAHRAALRAGLTTIAFPGSGLNEDVIYPRQHMSLAQQIVEHGGALVSECNHDQKATEWVFPQRNRLVAGISHAILIPEAKEKSGTLITARYASDYNRDLLIVPGNILSEQSRGTNQFLRLGATPIICASDLHEALGFERPDKAGQVNSHSDGYNDKNLSDIEKKILAALIEPMRHDEIIELLTRKHTELTTAEINTSLTMLEIKNCINHHGDLLRRNFVN